MPNDASQRTWGKGVQMLLLNKQYNSMQYFVWHNYKTIYLATMNSDGTNWKPIKLLDVEYGYDFLYGISDIYNDVLYVIVAVDQYPNVRFNILVKYNISDGAVTKIDLPGVYGQRYFFDFTEGKIYYHTQTTTIRLLVQTTDLNGGNITTNTTTQTFPSYYELCKIGNYLVYIFRGSDTFIYTAVSDLDCGNFIKTKQDKQCLHLGTAATDGGYAYSFFVQNSTTSYICKTNGSSFTYVETEYFSYLWDEMFIDGGVIYLISLGYIAKYSTGLSYITSEVVYDGPETVWYTKIDPTNNINAWTQEQSYDNGNIYLSHLWTYPGNGTITPTTVQCQVTQTLVDASTGKAITPLIGGV